MGFDPIAAPIDYVVVSGQRTPGVATITFGSGSPRQWDERRGIDMSGAYLRFRGLKLASFSIKLQLCETADFLAWDAFKDVVLAVPRAGRGAHDVVHPILASVNIRSAVVEDIVPPTPDGDLGMWVTEIKMKERRPAAPASSTVNGSTNTPAPNPLQAEIEQNNRRIEMQNAEIARYR